MTRNGKARKRKWWKRLLIWLVLIAILAGAGWVGYQMLKQNYKTTYDGYTATIGSISNSLSFSGNISLVDSANYSASSNTSVRKVYVAVDDQVKSGDKLLRLANGESIEAEFDGRINVLNAKEGDDVVAGNPLVQLADFEHLRVSFRVDEYDISDVAVGDRCTVTAIATEKSYDSEIASIDYISASGGNVAYYTAVAYVDVSKEDGVYPGMQATVSITKEETKDAVILKTDALSFDPMNAAYVWMYDEAGALEQVYVETGISNGKYVEIKSGVADGDTVYVESTVEAENAAQGLLAGLFGSQQMNGPADMPGGGENRGNMGGFSGERPSGMGASAGGTGSTGGMGGAGGFGGSGGGR